jgi:hypothetical protein
MYDDFMSSLAIDRSILQQYQLNGVESQIQNNSTSKDI